MNGRMDLCLAALQHGRRGLYKREQAVYKMAGTLDVSKT